MNMTQTDISTPDKYDRFIEQIDQFHSLVAKKKELRNTLSQIQQEYQEKIRPVEEELSVVLKQLDVSISKLELAKEAAPKKGKYTKYGRGQLGAAIKDLLRSHPDRAFKPKEIADALNTKGTSVSLWFNKYGLEDEEIERIPSGAGGKRFVYKIK